jgi:hypothetical protein
MPAGRPTDYTQELADRICAQLSMGISLRTVCNAEDMPCKTTVFMWMRTKPEFLNQYARAKEESSDALVEDMLDISDNSDGDIEIDEDGAPRVNHENIQRAKLRVDTRKWIASKLKPKKYGEKLELAGDVNLGLSDRMRGALGSTEAE